MTIVELRDRLTDIIEDNEKRGWAERNESRVVIKHEPSKLIVEYRPVKYAMGSWLGLGKMNGTHEDVFEITTERDPIWRNRS